MNPNAKIPKNPLIFQCKNCDYDTFSKKDYLKHVQTKKHISLSNPNKSEQKSQKIPKNPKFQNDKIYECICGKMYSHKSTLCGHKKRCTFIETYTIGNDAENLNENDTEYDIKLLSNLVLEVVKQNKELMKENNDFKEMVFELCKNGTNVTNNMSNSHNKTFNLNVFLNETCKDAMNIMDFVDSLKLQLCDLEMIGEVGFVNGISDIIIKNLKALDVSKRPVHCADTKREVMYVKDNDKWEKEQEGNKKLKKAIKHIAKKNSMNINLFKDKYPDCVNSYSRKSDQFNKIYIEAYGGSGNEDVDNENKIIKNIAKVVFIDKTNKCSS